MTSYWQDSLLYLIETLIMISLIRRSESNSLTIDGLYNWLPESPWSPRVKVKSKIDLKIFYISCSLVKTITFKQYKSYIYQFQISK